MTIECHECGEQMHYYGCCQDNVLRCTRRQPVTEGHNFTSDFAFEELDDGIDATEQLAPLRIPEPSLQTYVGMTLEPGTMMLDTGAQVPLIGYDQLVALGNRLEEKIGKTWR